MHAAGAAIAIAAVARDRRRRAPPPTPLVSVAARADAPLSELGRPTVVTVPGGGLVQRYDQRVGGLPVLGAETVVAAPSGGAPMVVADSTAPAISRHDAGEAISRERAIDAAERGDRAERLRGPAKASSGSTRRPARSPGRSRCPPRPLADFVVTLDGRTGEKLRSRDVLRHATATAAIYRPEPGGRAGRLLGPARPQGQGLAAADRAAADPSAARGSRAARAACSGTYVDARLGKKGTKVCDQALDFTNVTRSNDRFEALMAYFHIDRTGAYADSLGLSQPLRASRRRCSRTRSPTTTRSTRPMTHELVLGTGGVDDGEDADVIVHEYGHSLQDQASPGSLQKREGATMGEGFGDYVAAMMSALTTGGEPVRHLHLRLGRDPYSPTGTCGRLADTAPTTSRRPSAGARRRSTASARSGRRPCSSCAIALGNDPQGRSVMDRVALESQLHAHADSRTSATARAR